MHDFHKQILGLVSAGVLAKSHSITCSCILVWVFSCKFLQYFEKLFFRTISLESFFKFNLEKYSIATTWDSFKDYILTCKTRNQMHTKFAKRKVRQVAISNFAQKWLFCKTYVLFYLRPEFLKNTFEVVHTYYRSFSRKIHIHIYWTATSVTVTLHQIFRIYIFYNSHFWLVIEKSREFINEN